MVCIIVFFCCHVCENRVWTGGLNKCNVILTGFHICILLFNKHKSWGKISVEEEEYVSNTNPFFRLLNDEKFKLWLFFYWSRHQFMRLFLLNFQNLIVPLISGIAGLLNKTRIQICWKEQWNELNWITKLPILLIFSSRQFIIIGRGTLAGD